MFKDFYRQVRTKVAFASVYHPQINGAIERANALLFEAVKKILEGEKKGKWADSSVESQHNGLQSHQFYPIPPIVRSRSSAA
jgi:hypothetical protein